MNGEILKDILYSKLGKKPQGKVAAFHPFFDAPNRYSNYHLNIRHGKNHQYLTELSPFSRFGDGLIDENRKLIIFTSPKCGSSTVKHFAENSLGLSRQATEEEKNNGQQEVWPVLTNTQIKASRKNIRGGSILWNNYASYRKTLVIRDPYERLVSFWINKLFWLLPFYGGFERDNYLRQNPNFKLHKRFLYNTTQNIEDTTFEDFVESLYSLFKRENIKLWDEHLSPQITPDFFQIALAQTEVIPLHELNNFLNCLVDKPHLNLKINSTTKNESVYRPKAHLLTMKQVYLLELKVTKDSFFNASLAQKITEMYPNDTAVWQALKA